MFQSFPNICIVLYQTLEGNCLQIQWHVNIFENIFHMLYPKSEFLTINSSTRLSQVKKVSLSVCLSIGKVVLFLVYFIWNSKSVSTTFSQLVLYYNGPHIKYSWSHLNYFFDLQWKEVDVEGANSHQKMQTIKFFYALHPNP